jgi:hypothetical protein
MGFLQRFLRPTAVGIRPVRPSTFESLSPAQLESHLDTDRYGDFLLTNAIRPAFDLRVVPRTGYRHDVFQDEQSRQEIPVLAASASRERLFELFLELLDPLGDRVDVVLESSHDPEIQGHVDLYREDIDLVVLKSLLYDFEDLLMQDGYTGIAVLRPDVPMEVQFDEHKLLFVYARNLRPFQRVLREHGIERDDQLQLISEAEHVHLTEEPFVDQFAELKLRIGVEDGRGLNHLA